MKLLLIILLFGIADPPLAMAEMFKNREAWTHLLLRWSPKTGKVTVEPGGNCIRDTVDNYMRKAMRNIYSFEAMWKEFTRKKKSNPKPTKFRVIGPVGVVKIYAMAINGGNNTKIVSLVFYKNNIFANVVDQCNNELDTVSKLSQSQLKTFFSLSW